MSRREWKPGDVALRTSELTPSMISVVVPGCAVDRHADGPHWHHASGGWDRLVARHATYRPLVVLDPEDRETAGRLLAAWFVSNGPSEIDPAAIARKVTHLTQQEVDRFQTALRSLIAPPKPEEPQGLGAVVEDAEGARAVHRGSGRWVWENEFGLFSWNEIDAVKVLSEGVS